MPSQLRCFMSWIARWPTVLVAGVTLALIVVTSCGLGVFRYRDATSTRLQFGAVTVTAHELMGATFQSVLPNSPSNDGWQVNWTPEYRSWSAPFALWRPESHEGAIPGIYLDNRTGRFRETTVPLWPVVALGLVISIPAWRKFLRSRHRLKNGLCVVCGYSGTGLPASPGRPTRCPGCGLEAAEGLISALDATPQ